MKNIVKIALAVGLALILFGCKQSAAPAYSPDGKSLAYSNGKTLKIHRDGLWKTLANSNPVEISWSPNSRFIAWTTTYSSPMRPGKPREFEEKTWIHDFLRDSSHSRSGIGGKLGWLHGDLVATGPDLNLLDPESLQTRSKVDLSGGDHIASSASRGELYIGGVGAKGSWDSFDGLHLSSMAGSEPMLPACMGMEETAFFPIPTLVPQRTLTLSRWNGNRFEPFKSVSFPERIGKRNSISVMPQAAVVSADGRVVVASILAIRGTPSQERKLIDYAKKRRITLEKASSLKSKDELNRLLNKMLVDEVIYVWSPNRSGALAESDNAKEVLTIRIALDPDAKHLAYASDRGLKVIAIP